MNDGANLLKQSVNGQFFALLAMPGEPASPDWPVTLGDHTLPEEVPRR